MNHNQKSKFIILVVAVIAAFAFYSCTGPEGVTIEALKNAIDAGETSGDPADRYLIIDVRDSRDFIEGHIKDALSVPYAMIQENGDPLYTNGWDEVSTTAATGIENSWLAHVLINQLINDFVSTYQDSRIVFYGSAKQEGLHAAQVASKAGYKNVSYLDGSFSDWKGKYADMTEQYYAGIESVDLADKSFVMEGYINNTNFTNVSTRGTHHCIIYEGGGLKHNSIFQVKMAPFPFQELLTYIGASPEGNMAEGIYFGEMEIWQDKFPDGQRVEYSVTWDGADGYYRLDEVFDEKPSEFDPDPETFIPVGIEERIGGTRDSNINFNPGCIFCWYACVCGITSNAKANEITWFDDGGIYDFSKEEDERNYYAGRYYPKMDILPGEGEEIKVKTRIVE